MSAASKSMSIGDCVRTLQGSSPGGMHDKVQGRDKEDAGRGACTANARAPRQIIAGSRPHLGAFAMWLSSPA